MDDYLKCALLSWGKSEHSGNRIGLGISPCNYLGRWMEEGIIPPTKHKPDEQHPIQQTIDKVNTCWQALNRIDRAQGVVLITHYKHAHKPIEERFRRSKYKKTTYYAKLDKAHDFMVRNFS